MPTGSFAEFADVEQRWLLCPSLNRGLVRKPPASRHPKARAGHSYHFLEVLRRRNRLILPLELSEMESPPFAGDRSEWKFIANAQHSGGGTSSVTS
jgi:hypothetical protein